MRYLAAILLVLLGLMSVGPVFAVNPDEMLNDPVLEARARALSSGLRCLVCQNQSIDDSDAELARELRILVRERIKAGDSDEEAVQFLVDRYGEFVRLQPVVAPHTLLLWVFAPALLLLSGGILIVRARRKKEPGDPVILTDDERSVLHDLEGDPSQK